MPVATGSETPQGAAGVLTPTLPVGVASEVPAFLPQVDRKTFTGLFPKGTLAGSSKRAKLVNEAFTWLGIDYVWGGASRSGVDCSGLVQQVFAQFGINLDRVSYQQAGSGPRVALDALQPGDLVAWDNSARNNGADHIAIYAGDGYIIEAPRRGLQVRRRKLLPDENAFGVSMSSYLQ